MTLTKIILKLIIIIFLMTVIQSKGKFFPKISMIIINIPKILKISKKKEIIVIN